MVAAAEFRCVREGPHGRVLLSPRVAAAYQEILEGTDERSVKRRTRLTRYFDQFCNNKPHHLNEDQFKRQGAFSDGEGKQVVVWEFKAWQWRVYGPLLLIGETVCFVGLHVDEDKKRNKADPDLLKITAKDTAKLVEYGAGSDEKKQNSGGESDGRSARKHGRQADRGGRKPGR